MKRNVLAYRKDLAEIGKAVPSLLKRGEKAEMQTSLRLRLLGLILIATAPLILAYFCKRFVERLYQDMPQDIRTDTPDIAFANALDEKLNNAKQRTVVLHRDIDKAYQ